MLGDAEGEEELRLAIEKQSTKAVPLTGLDQIAEIEMTGQILPARIREQVACDAML